MPYLAESDCGHYTPEEWEDEDPYRSQLARWTLESVHPERSVGAVQGLRRLLESYLALGSSAQLTRQSISAKFDRLARQWRLETAHFSVSLRKAMHPAYQQIIGMGYDAVPLILRELEEHGGYWFWALAAITGDNPVPPDCSYPQALEAWLAWGRKRRML